jgi:hypothetical protein
MGLSSSLRFLREANRIAGTGDYFRWSAVGAALGYSDDQSIRALESLDERKLLILLVDGHARLLRAGRRRAAELEATKPGR